MIRGGSLFEKNFMSHQNSLVNMSTIAIVFITRSVLNAKSEVSNQMSVAKAILVIIIYFDQS